MEGRHVLYGERFELAADLADQAMRRLHAENIPANPDNFALWYAYYSGRFPDLVRAVDIIASNKLPFTQARCAELYRQFFSPSVEEGAIIEASDRLTRVLEAVSGLVAAAGQEGDALSGAAAQFRDRADLARTLDEVRATVRQLAEQATRVAIRNQLLQAQLNSNAQQLDAMRRNLDTVMVEALTDALTGLPNRKQFDQSLRTAAAAAGEMGTPLCLLMIDIDFFKRFNDSHGHVVGDQVLKLVGRMLADSVHGRDTACRFGGEEFAVVMPESSLGDALDFAERLRRTVAARRVVRRASGAEIGGITLSIGVAQYSLGEPLGRLIQRADDALYRAKHNGRNQVVADIDEVEPAVGGSAGY